LGFLARSYARTLDRLADFSRALSKEPGAAEAAMPKLLKAAARLGEALTRLMDLPEPQRRPHRRPNSGRKDV